MKHWLMGLCTVAAVLACVNMASVAVSGEAYEGTGEGFRGHILVRVYFSGDSIQEIEIVSYEEDEFVGGIAMETLSEAILDAHSTAVDAVSGATESSTGFLEAVNAAIGEWEAAKQTRD
jgi:fumarate reductase flavoprotein subunit